MTLDKRRFTPAQSEAIEEYRKASSGNDFIALLTSVTDLAKVALYEEDATEAIAMGYEIYGNDNDNEKGAVEL